MRKRTPSKNLVVDTISYEACPAKTYESKCGQIIPGRSVLNHCQIVGEVAKEIIRRMIGGPAKKLFPAGSALVAAAHDNGKICPTFYNKIMRACSLPQVTGASPDMEYQWGGHAGVSQLTAKYLNLPEYVPEILGQHHGFSPNLSGLRADDEIFGSKSWLLERKKLITELENVLEESWPSVGSVAQARVLAGLTSVADWIGSGRFFENPVDDWRENISQAVNDAGFVPPSYKTHLSFNDVFGFSPRQPQTLLIERVESPGVYVLEAPMGLGKTEAALFAAYRMLDGRPTASTLRCPLN